MKLNKNTTKTIFVALLVGLLAYLNLPIPKNSVEDVVDSILDSVEVESEPVVITSSAVVSFVIDGDTFVVVQNGREITVRVLGIDTPETKNSPSGAECFGDKASVRARQLLKGVTVELQTDETQSEFDTYGRLLAYVEVNSEFDLGAKLITEGFAKEYTYRRAYKKQREYRDLELQAKQAKSGLWGVCE